MTPGAGRITVGEDAAPGSRLTMRGDALDSLLRWAPRPGEAVTVTTPAGRLLRARVETLGEDSATLAVFEEAGRLRTPPVEITLLQAVPEKERMELVIEKTTELGVGRIVPIVTARSTTTGGRDKTQKKSHRWGKRALKAAKQCRRPDIPEILPEVDLAGALRLAEGAELKVMLWEGRDAARLKDAIAGAHPGAVEGVVILTGPEGGFTPEEVEKARGAGFVPVSLGNRILRTETAAIIAVGIVGYELGW